MSTLQNHLSPSMNAEIAVIHDDFNHVADSVKSEVTDLRLQGFDVALIDTPDVFSPEPGRADMIDDEINRLEQSPDGAVEFRSRPGISKWAPLTKRAIALHTLYNPHSSTVGEGIEENIYDAPLFNGVSAKQMLQQQLATKPGKAEEIIKAYEDFVSAPIETEEYGYVGSRDFFKGVKDAEAVRTRATAAMELVSEHIADSPLMSDRQDLVSASLACGAAGPVYNMVSNLEARGHNFKDVILVDNDPMALATAHSLANGTELADKVRIGMHDLVAEPLTGFIEPNSVDVVDLLGLFEYFPEEKGMEFASMMISKVREIVRPGGYIVFGNMLNERPQQDFFSKVVGWPKLYQRTITDVQEIVARAGFDAKDLQVRVPSEGVYAVYGLRVPALIESDVENRSVAQELGREALALY